MKKADKNLVLKTKDLIICHTVSDDISVLMEIENHPDNAIYIWHNTEEEHMEELKDPEVLTLTFKAKDDGRMVGYVICVMDYHSERFELKRWAFSPDEKRKGFGRQAIYALMKYAFEDLDTNKFWLEAYPDNEAGNGLYVTSGLKLDGILRQNYKEERGILDQLQYSMLKDEYFGLKKQGFFG